MSLKRVEGQIDLFARHGQLDLINTNANVVIDDLPHLLRSISVSRDSSNQLAIAARHLFAVGQVSRAGQVAGVDGIANHHVQSILC